MKNLYKAAWDVLENATPLETNCGTLCDARCCKGEDEDGMLLFPGEEQLYNEIDGSWFQIIDSEIVLPSGYIPKFLVCQGTCPRAYRPLSCRIFPLLPILDDEDYLEFLPDLHAALLCPLLSSEKAPPIQPDFIDALYDAFAHLLENEDVVAFIEMLTKKNEAISNDLARFYDINTNE